MTEKIFFIDGCDEETLEEVNNMLAKGGKVKFICADGESGAYVVVECPLC